MTKPWETPASRAAMAKYLQPAGWACSFTHRHTQYASNFVTKNSSFFDLLVNYYLPKFKNHTNGEFSRRYHPFFVYIVRNEKKFIIRGLQMTIVLMYLGMENFVCEFRNKKLLLLFDLLVNYHLPKLTGNITPKIFTRISFFFIVYIVRNEKNPPYEDCKWLEFRCI